MLWEKREKNIHKSDDNRVCIYFLVFRGLKKELSGNSFFFCIKIVGNGYRCIVVVVVNK